MSSSGTFATSRRSHVGEDAAYIQDKLAAGVPQSAVARMAGVAVSDVRALARLGAIRPIERVAPAARQAEALQAPGVVKVLSLWRGELLVTIPRTSRHVLAEVAARHRVRVEDLKGPSRTRALAQARQEAMWELRERLGYSLPRIGALLGGRDHTTILHGIRVHAARMCGESAE